MGKYFNRKLDVLMLGVVFIASACATTTPIVSNDPQPSLIAMMTKVECKQTQRKNDWDACSRDGALSTYQYAQLSSNVYSDIRKFVLPAEITLALDPDEAASGLSYQVYHRIVDGKVVEKIISYRGTDFSSLRDWWFGNIGSRQRREAISIFDQINTDTIPTSVTGHSLGGALATQVSLCRDVHLNIVFDTSPRFSKKMCDQTYINRNTSLAEYGEVNKLLRIFGTEPDQRYISLGCLSEGWGITQHAMSKLAACLTNIAAIDDPDAELSRVQNNIPADADDWDI
jgi:hypothetical protein